MFTELERQRQEEDSKFETSLVFIVSSRTARSRNFVLKKQKQTNNKPNKQEKKSSLILHSFTAQWHFLVF